MIENQSDMEAIDKTIIKSSINDIKGMQSAIDHDEYNRDDIQKEIVEMLESFGEKDFKKSARYILNLEDSKLHHELLSI